MERLIKIGKENYRDMLDFGWCDPTKSDAHYVMLIIGELCEAIQAHRRGKMKHNHPVADKFLSDYIDNPDLPSTLFRESFEFYCKDSTADELADTTLRLLSLYNMRGYDHSLIKDAAMRLIVGIEDGAKTGTFTEKALAITKILVDGMDKAISPETIVNALTSIVLLAEDIGTDIYTSCERKMRYNRVRNDWKNEEKRY